MDRSRAGEIGMASAAVAIVCSVLPWERTRHALLGTSFDVELASGSALTLAVAVIAVALMFLFWRRTGVLLTAGCGVVIAGVSGLYIATNRPTTYYFGLRRISVTEPTWAVYATGVAGLVLLYASYERWTDLTRSPGEFDVDV